MKLSNLLVTLFVVSTAINAQVGMPSVDRPLLITVSTVQGCGYYHESLKPALTKEYLGVIARTGVNWPKDIWSPRMFSEQDIKKSFKSAPSRQDCERYIANLASGKIDQPIRDAYHLGTN
jgi:hypothetical protein